MIDIDSHHPAVMAMDKAYDDWLNDAANNLPNDEHAYLLSVALEHLDTDTLRSLPLVQDLMGYAWDEGRKSTRHPTYPLNPFRPSPPLRTPSTRPETREAREDAIAVTALIDAHLPVNGHTRYYFSRHRRDGVDPRKAAELTQTDWNRDVETNRPWTHTP